MKGNLYLIPSPLDRSARNFFTETELLNSINYFIFETPKAGRANLRQNGFERPLREVTVFELNKHTKEKDISSYLQPCLEGQDVALMSDSGCPAIADPGALVVSLAHEMNISVKPFIGPSSITLALMSSGLNGQNFSFEGYIPKEKNARISRLKQLEDILSKTKRTIIFIETPFRSQHLFNDIISNLNGKTKLCVAADLTSSSEYIRTDFVSGWLKGGAPDLNKKPCVFLLGR